jgi:hypothetical protein
MKINEEKMFPSMFALIDYMQVVLEKLPSGMARLVSR